MKILKPQELKARKGGGGKYPVIIQALNSKVAEIKKVLDSGNYPEFTVKELCGDDSVSWLTPINKAGFKVVGQDMDAVESKTGASVTYKYRSFAVVSLPEKPAEKKQ